MVNVELREISLSVEGNWWYDEGNACVIALVERNGRVSLSVKWVKEQKFMLGMIGSYPKGTLFLSAKLSMDGLFLALQRSDVEIEIAVLKEPHHRFNIMCKRTARILGIVWSSKIAYLKSMTEYLVLITTEGLEFYKVSQIKCRFHRLVAHTIYQYWYNPLGHLLLLNTGEKANEYRPYILESSIITICSKLIIRLQRQDVIYLATLYKTQYIVHSSVNQLLFYHVEAGCDTKCVRALALPFPHEAKLQFAVVDDILIAYSNGFDVACFYDIAIDTPGPILPPLPLKVPVPGAWQFYFPNYACSMDNCTWTEIHLELYAIAQCAGRRTDVLIPFLLRRNDAVAAKTCILQSLSSRMIEEAHVDELTGYFLQLHRIYQAAVLERSACDSWPSPSITSSDQETTSLDFIDLREFKHNRLVILQHECLLHLWLPLFETLSPQQFHLYLVSYLHTLQVCKVLIDPNLLVLYIQVMVARQLCHESLILLANQSDSILVAQELEKHSSSYRPYFQIVLDIYHRLGTVDQVLRMLLDDGNVTMAFRLALRYFHKHEELPALCTPLWFFTKVVHAVRKARSMCWQWFSGLHLLLVAIEPQVITSGTLANMYKSPFPSEYFYNKEMAKAMATKF
ncbi:hypothetical protein THRCLA_08077, partial [Thraustotheca clavata]